MQDSSVTKYAPSYLYSNTGNSTVSSVQSVKGFVHSGFGRNDVRRRTRPTAGSYVKNTEFRPWGQGGFVRLNSANQPTNWQYTIGNLGGYHGTLWNYTNTQPSYDSTTYNNCLSKLYDEIRGAEANIAMTLAESGETGRMGKRAIQSMWKILSTARRVRREAIANPSKLISEIWLSYKYGWLPAYMDVYAYLQYTTRRFDEMTFKARKTRKETSRARLVSSDYIVWTTMRREWRAEVSVTAKVSDSSAFDLTRITSLNPISIAWELVPFSFVVDWFYDVGGWLQLQEAALGSGLTFVRGYRTQVAFNEWNERWTRDAVVNEVGGSKTVYFHNDSAGIHRAIKQRDVLTSFPRPVAPRFECKLGWQRILSAAALIRVVLLGKVK